MSATPATACNEDSVATMLHPRIGTRNPHGQDNGFVVPIYNRHDAFFHAHGHPEQVYLSVVGPLQCKGPHLHRIRTGLFTCIRGDVNVILKFPDGRYTQHFSGEHHEYRSIEVPAGVAALIVNLAETEAFLINMPHPAWTKEMNDEHTADYADCPFLAAGTGSAFAQLPVARAVGREKVAPVLSCRICGESRFEPILDLGPMPPANSFLKLAEALDAERFPLRLQICTGCKLVQLADKVRPDLLYRHYEYMSSASKPLQDYFTNYGNVIVDRFGLGRNDLVVEIGGNDGILLGTLRDRCRVLNVDPARRVVDACRRRGIPATTAFFSHRVAGRILEETGPARVITASNVVGHIDDLHDLFAGVKRLLRPNGVFAVEVHWVGNLIGEGGFDQIYHEHLSYFSLATFARVAEAEGLPVFDVELTPMHGALLRVFMSASVARCPSVGRFLEREQALGLDRAETYRAFAGKVARTIDEFSVLIAGLRAKGRRIAGYGAPAKGNTLLNACGLDYRSIDYIVDTTPHKQWLYSPGGRIPVVPPDVFSSHPPDYAVLFAWNYADAILQKEQEFRRRGGRFIIPVPTPRVV